MNAITTAQIPQITIQGDTLTTTSTAVAEFFKRKHKNVIQTIEKLKCSAEFTLANFSAHVKTVAMPKGATRQDTYYEMTQDGFTILAMGFTGERAMAFKESYIKTFRTMETELLQKYKQAALPSTISPGQKLRVRDAIGAKVYAEYPEGKRQLGFSAVYKEFYHHFGISKYAELPVEQFEQAIEWLQGEIVEQKFTPAQPYEVRPILANKRFLLSYDYEGRESIQPIPKDANVMSTSQVLKTMHEGNSLPVSTEEFADFAMATIKVLKNRADFYQMKASTTEVTA